MKLKPTIKILIWLTIGVILFHLAILINLIPCEVTWGRRLKNNSEMYVFEGVSILVNLFLVFVLLIKGDYLPILIPERVLNIILWIYLSLFGLNTIGNIFAETLFEKSLSLLTLIFTYLVWTILKKDKKLPDL